MLPVPSSPCALKGTLKKASAKSFTCSFKHSRDVIQVNRCESTNLSAALRAHGLLGTFDGRLLWFDGVEGKRGLTLTFFFGGGGGGIKLFHCIARTGVYGIPCA